MNDGGAPETLREGRRWTCPTCGAAVATPFCPACGERQPHPHELTLPGMLHHAVQAFTNLDGRLWRTLGDLLRRPGALTVLFHQGSRKPYIGPFTLFLLTNVLFVAMEHVPDSDVFSTPLYKHMHNQPWGSLAQALVARRLASEGTTLDAYAPTFDQAVARNAQSLIILMALGFALLLPVVFRKSRMPFAVHLAFSLHFHAFLLLLLSAALLIPTVDVWLGGPGLAAPALDSGIAVGATLISAAYLYLSIGRVYGNHGATRVFEAVLLALAVAGLFLGYRFTLLLVTLYTT